MLIDKSMEKTFSLLQKLRDIHVDSISSHKKMDTSVDPPAEIITQSDEKDTLFESIETNIRKIETALSKKLNFTSVDFEYSKPKERIQKPLKSDAIKSKLSVLKGELVSFSDQMKNENYRLINGNTNESHTLTPTEKGLFKKTITGFEQLIELY